MYIKKNILLVEDEDKLRQTVKSFLEINDYIVEDVDNGERALEVFIKNINKFDMILLDVMLPKLDGYAVLEEIRKVSDVPVIMVTAKDSPNDQIKGFRFGSDDYITKPYLLSVLKVRMEAIFKRMNRYSKIITMGALKILQDSQNVYLQEKKIIVTPKEYQLLCYFIENENIVLSRNQILTNVWGIDYEGGERTVDTLVKQLRIKLKEYSFYIQSIYGVGYRFEVKNNENY